MTSREAAIVSAYTGILLGDFATLHAYVEEKFGHPVWTHEMSTESFAEQLRTLSRADFLSLEVSDA